MRFAPRLAWKQPSLASPAPANTISTGSIGTRYLGDATGPLTAKMNATQKRNKNRIVQFCRWRASADNPTS
jgi:hypothetical protein